MKFWLGVLAAIGAAALAAWVIWGPFLSFCLSMAPADIWWWKPLCVVAVGYFGGVAIPLIILTVGMTIAINYL
jgi:hypothetical protein